MIAKMKPVEGRRDASLRHAAPRSREGGFKPVALPALAAAVEAARSTAERKPARRDDPALLQKLGILD